MSRRDDRDVIVIEPERGGSAAWWLLLGASVGAGLALLFAPRSGAETRRALGRRLARFREDAEVAIDELKDELRGALGDDEPAARRSLADEGGEEEAGADEEKPAAPRARRGGDAEPLSARQELERRLAEARARRRRALAADEDEEPVA